MSNPVNKAKEICFGNMTLKIGAKEVSLTVEEAKRLKGELEKTFGVEKLVVKEAPGYWPSYVQGFYPPPALNMWTSYSDNRAKLEDWYLHARRAIENHELNMRHYRMGYPYYMWP